MKNIKTKRLITSALPYVNNIPHLGNLIQMLSADVFARFCRSRGYETMYVCGTDEYGTATETKALQENKTPRELCDYYYAIHKDIYEWFDIAFDKFGRTSNEECTEITQFIFNELDKNGFIKEHSSKQLFCTKCNMFLADRYVDGTCPKCGATDARGDQCDSCGTLLDPTQLLEPRCHTCGSTPEVRETKHLYIDLPSIAPKLEDWMGKTSKEGKWAANAIQMTKAWIRDGLNERAITRDLKWGIPVPKAGYENKVFYVWFNAPIGYMSITKQLADEMAANGKQTFDWRKWWLPSESTEKFEDDADLKLFQFIGKDNIPFHTVVFPCSEIGTGKDWTKLFHMSSTEFLNYEDGKFSKSKGIGVFGSDAKESGIPSDAWRFYIYFNRPEKQDYQFTWKDFQEKYNKELIGNLGNLVNRALTFTNKNYGGKIPAGKKDEALWAQIIEKEKKVTELLEWAELKDALHEIFEISDICNKAFQDAAPWKAIKENKEVADNILYNLAYAIKDLMIMIQPYLPKYSQTVASYFGKSIYTSTYGNPGKEDALTWDDLGKLEGLDSISATEIYFRPIDDKQTAEYRARYAGKQDARTENAESADKKKKEKKAKKEKKEPVVLPVEEQADFFNSNIELLVAKIVDVKPNPEGEKLYIETLDDGSGTPRTIQSGLRMYLKEEELLGKHVVIAANLAPRTMRGVESRGMLLAGDYKDGDKDCVEVLDVSWAKPGTRIVLEGADANAQKKAEITGDEFFSVAINAVNGSVQIAGKKLLADGKEIKTVKALNSEIG
ncbi:methionine--tRNA ligase [Treponema zioleckii]|uniref:methionine--tRNA ligase n=1 Tax=Treponema zioleckii TaxID=331680 RepID=UPI00168A517B|nr:methionine--tRNA ligase [Treponema zioleckii]